MDLWQTELIRAARSSKVKFESVEVVGNEAHARAVIAVLQAFGDDTAGTVLAEPRTPDRRAHENARPTDILVLHPRLGCLLIEVKAWRLAEISGIEAGTIFRRVAGYEEAHNPWHQAQQASAQIQKAARRVLERRGAARTDLAFFDWVVAFPNISRAAWEESGYGQAIADCELLLQDDLRNAQALRPKLERYVKAKAGSRIPCTVEQLDHVREALGSSYVLRSRRRRSSDKGQGKLGDTIDAHEVKDKRLSREQIELIEAEFDGRPQLVRGVAGSGKSVVLVRNLVNLLDRHRNSALLPFEANPPAKRYAIVCFNRSLAPFLQNNFEEAFRQQTYQNPPACVDILSINKLQYRLSNKHGGPLTYQRWDDVERTADVAARFAARYSEQLDAFARADKAAFEKLQYDAIYVDEGQDLFEEEYLFLMRLLRVDPATGDKNIVIFYDDAQNLYGRPRPTWSNLGIQITGRRTYVMKKCFRNSKPVIDFAFNVLLGIRSQTRVFTKGFADLAYLRENDLVTELPDRWQVHFAERVEGQSPTVELFATRGEETEWVVATLSELLCRQDVRPEDVLILFSEPGEYADFPNRIRRECPMVRGFVQPFGQGRNPAKDEYIFKEGHITFTTVRSAKGYDAPIVFVLGTDLFPTSVTGRASFYVAATRCKMRLYVTGLQQTAGLAEEAKAVSALLRLPAGSPEGQQVSRHLEAGGVGDAAARLRAAQHTQEADGEVAAAE